MIGSRPEQLPTRTRSLALLVAIVVVAVIRVSATHHVFNAGNDEPAHIAAGYDWLAGRPYTLDPTHPPLARILSALPLRMAGIPPSNETDFVARGNELLYFGDHYVRNVAHARWGNLLFLILGIVAIDLWGAHLFDRRVGLIGAALFSLLPPVLGHAGVATTDMAVAAMLPLALLALQCWLEWPSLRRALLLGVTIGFGLLAKFSFVPFFGAAAIVLVVFAIVLRRRDKTSPEPANVRAYVGGAAAAALLSLLIVWGGYRFSFGTTASLDPVANYLADQLTGERTRPLARWFAMHVPIPAPAFAIGIGELALHDREGHLAYLFGRYAQHGWWYYFPVTLFFKTPLGFLLLAAVGIAAAISRRDLRVAALLAVVLAILATVMGASIDIGIRHVLPIYGPLALIAAFGVATWSGRARSSAANAAIGLLAIWLVINSALAHPGYVAWFNEAAGRHPERILVDSNLDWGMDWLRVVAYLRQQNVHDAGIVYTGTIEVYRHGIHFEGIPPYTPVTGWIAASETGVKLAGNPPHRGEPFRWLDRYQPVKRIGGIYVYHIE